MISDKSVEVIQRLEKYQLSVQLHYVWSIIALEYIGETNNPQIRQQIWRRFCDVLETPRIMRQIRDYRVVCDDSNNPTSYLDTGAFCKVDIWINWDSNVDADHFEFPPREFR